MRSEIHTFPAPAASSFQGQLVEEARAAWAADPGSNPDLVTDLPLGCTLTFSGFHFPHI